MRGVSISFDQEIDSCDLVYLPLARQGSAKPRQMFHISSRILKRYAPRRAFKQIPVYTPENRKLSQRLRACAVTAGVLRPQAFWIPKEDDWDGFSRLAQAASARKSSGSEVT
jgi:hypothetical protein